MQLQIIISRFHSCFSFYILTFLASKMHPFPWIFRGFFVLLNQKRKIFITTSRVSKFLLSIKQIQIPKFDIFDEIEEAKHEISLLDLPDLALDSILEKLSPSELCSLAGVCSSMREKCMSDHLWQKLMKQKWGDVIGDAVLREWRSQIDSRRARRSAQESRFGLFSGLFGLKPEKRRSSSQPNLFMSCYLALESGKFWFPAQVFNRKVQNGHKGFVLSCYDARLSYGTTTDDFVARYRAQRRCIIEDGIEWKRIRAPNVDDTPANVLHISDCLHELRPGDHIEIQWRKKKDFPFGWWYGVVGHLDACGGNQFGCSCHLNDTIILEFRQYASRSRWRRAEISRKEHREVGDDAVGFYGGTRKLRKKEEIEKWKQLWPNCTLE